MPFTEKKLVDLSLEGTALDFFAKHWSISNDISINCNGPLPIQRKVHFNTSQITFKLIAQRLS